MWLRYNLPNDTMIWEAKFCTHSSVTAQGYSTSDYVTIILKAETNNKVYSAFPTYMQPIPPSDYVCFMIEVQFSKWYQYPTIADYSFDCLCWHDSQIGFAKSKLNFHAMTLECSFNGSFLENDVPWGGAVMPEWNLPRAQLCVPLMGLFPYVSLYKKCISVGTETIKLTFHGVGLLFRHLWAPSWQSGLW